MSDDIPQVNIKAIEDGERILDLMEILKAALAKDSTRTTTNPQGATPMTEGWTCPKCGCVWGPSTQQCFRCNAEVIEERRPDGGKHTQHPDRPDLARLLR